MELSVRKRIVQSGGQFCVESYRTGRRLGCYPTRAQAEARLRQVEAYKSDVQVSKIDEAEQNVFGWANVATDESGHLIVDRQGDIIEPEVLEKAAYDFVLDYGESGAMHEGKAEGRVIESIIFTPTKLEKMGLTKDALPISWWVGFHYDDPEVFAKFRDGEYRMFSIQGRGHRLPA